jgi:hypothetical protein
MLLSVVGLGFCLIVFGLVLFTVHRIRPETFKLKAQFTKWISLDLEMRAPGRPSSERKQLPRRR